MSEWYSGIVIEDVQWDDLSAGSWLGYSHIQSLWIEGKVAFGNAKTAKKTSIIQLKKVKENSALFC